MEHETLSMKKIPPEQLNLPNPKMVELCVILEDRSHFNPQFWTRRSQKCAVLEVIEKGVKKEKKISKAVAQALIAYGIPQRARRAECKKCFER